MREMIRFDNALNIFQDTVTLYRDEEGRLHIGNTYCRGVNGEKDGYMTVMYREALPEDTELLLGWNLLDDGSSQELIAEERAETGIEDFCYAHGLERDWRSLDYYVVDNYREISDFVRKNPLKKGEVAAFGIRRA